MHHSSCFHFGKIKNMHRDYHERKLTGRHRSRDPSHIKLTHIFKSLRRWRLRRDVSHRSSLIRPRRSFSPPSTNHDSSPVQPVSPDLSTSPSLHILQHRSDAVRLLSATEEDCSSGMTTSCCSLQGTLPDIERGRRFSPPPIPAFPTSPLIFQLRSASTNDYLVEQLEQHMRRLSLGDASPHNGTLPKNVSRDIPMDVCLGSPNVAPQRTVGRATSSHSALSDRDAHKSISSPHDQNVVPMILITSVGAKQAKPLPPSAQRPSRTPFGQSDLINHPTNAPSAKSERTMIPDDPFTAQPHGSAYPPDYNYNFTFRLPSFPSIYSSPAKYAPETPTPMCCDHVGDCRGDLWEILHPPLVPGTLTLPPFKLPPLSTGLFNDMSTPLSY